MSDDTSTPHGVGRLLVWAHAIVWLQSAEIQDLIHGLADISGASYWLFAGLVAVPACVGWTVFGAVTR